MKHLAKFSIYLSMMILSPLWRGFVFSKLWLWFIVTTFKAAPLGIAQSIGLSLVVGFLTYQHDNYEDKSKSESERLIATNVQAICFPAWLLLIGWVVTFWM